MPVNGRGAPTDEHSARLVSESIALHLTTLLREMNADVRGMLRASDIAQSLDEFARTGVHTVSGESLHALNARAINAVANLANQQDGRPSVRARDWRMMFLCLIGSSSLRDAITRAADFYEMLEDRWGRLTLQVSGATSEVRFESMRTRRNGVALVADSIGIAALHGLLSWLIGQAIPLTAVQLQYEPALRRYFLRDTLPFPVRMAADRTAIQFASEYLDFPVIRNAQDAGYRLLALDLQEHGANATLAERARRVMYQGLRSGHRVPSLQDLSDSLQQNRATLRRQLRQAGASYNQLKESCRREVALDLLRRTSLSVESVAEHLGFCDSDAFRRAFRSWIGASPSSYRRLRDVRPAHEAN